MNNIQILEPSKIFNEPDTYNSSSSNNNTDLQGKLSYSFMSKDSSSSYKKQQIQQGNDSFTMSEFTSSYTKRTMTKNISTSTNPTSTNPFSIDDLTNMNQLYSSQKQLALPYNQSNSGSNNQEVVYDFMKLKNQNNLDSYIKPLEQASCSLRPKAPYELFTNFK